MDTPWKWEPHHTLRTGYRIRAPWARLVGVLSFVKSVKRGHDDNEQRESVWVGLVHFHGAMGAGAHLPHGGVVEVFHPDADGARSPDVPWLV